MWFNVSAKNAQDTIIITRDGQSSSDPEDLGTIPIATRG
jgi:hypothetical protein